MHVNCNYSDLSPARGWAPSVRPLGPFPTVLTPPACGLIVGRWRSNNSQQSLTFDGIMGVAVHALIVPLREIMTGWPRSAGRAKPLVVYKLSQINIPEWWDGGFTAAGRFPVNNMPPARLRPMCPSGACCAQCCRPAARSTAPPRALIPAAPPAAPPPPLPHQRPRPRPERYAGSSH